MTMTLRLFLIFNCLALLSPPAIFQQKAGDFKNFILRFEGFELPGAVLGNSVQGIRIARVFLWFASKGWLHRCDGQNFVTCRRYPSDPNSR